MKSIRKYIQYGQQEGPVQELGEWRLTPQSWVFLINTPWGGLVWNRPTAVIAQKNALIQRIPIPDPTRSALITFMVVGALATIISHITERR